MEMALQSFRTVEIALIEKTALNERVTSMSRVDNEWIISEKITIKHFQA